MAGKRLPQQGMHSAADSYDPKGHPASSMGPSANMGTPSGGGSPQFNPRNGYVKVSHKDGSRKIGVPTSLKWRFGALVDKFNVLP